MKLKNLLSELTKNFTLLPKQKDDFSFQKSRPVLHSISKSPKGPVHLKKQLKKSILRVDIFALLFINEPLATLKKVTESCHFALLL